MLDRFRDGDDSVLEAMAQGTVEWSPGVAERWTRQVYDALDARLKSLSQALQLGLGRAAGDATAIGQAMLSARRSLARLRAFAETPCIPPQVAGELAAALQRWARESQSSLEKSAAAIRNDHGRMLKIVRDQPLDAHTPSSKASSPAVPPAPCGRRVIL